MLHFVTLDVDTYKKHCVAGLVRCALRNLMWASDWVETAEIIRGDQHDSKVKGESHWRHDGDSVY